MKLSVHQQIFSQNISRLIIYANSLGVNLTFGEAFRSQDQQELYYYGKTIHPDDGELTIVNDKKRTRTMNSNHLKRLAIDFNFFIDGKLFYKHPDIEKIGAYWEKLDKLNRWGGNFTNFYDAPHFERNV
jgi:hypothetical protein